MKKVIITLCAAVVVGVAILTAAWLRGAEKRAAPDLEAVRTDLKERLANGELTEAEAQVRFAEAFARSKELERQKNRPKLPPKLPPELEALGAEIKEQVKEGELTEEEAKARWIKARKQAGTRGKGTPEKAKGSARARAKAEGTKER